jgi:hypothetical protein
VSPRRHIDGGEVHRGFCPAASSAVWCDVAPWLVGGDYKGNQHLIMVSATKPYLYSMQFVIVVFGVVVHGFDVQIRLLGQSTEL